MTSGGTLKSKFSGFDDLAQKLHVLKDDEALGTELRKGVRAAMMDVKKRAEGLIPQGIDPHRSYKGRLLAPGYARRSIRVISRLDKTGHKAIALVGVRAEAFYALQFVELGTSKMAARPWLRPAFAASLDPSVQKIAQGLREWIEALAARHLKAGNADRAAVLLAGIT